MQRLDARFLPDRLGFGQGTAQIGIHGHHFGQRRLPLDVDGRMVHDRKPPPVLRHRGLHPGARLHGRRPDHAVAGQRLVLGRPLLQRQEQLHFVGLPVVRRLVRQLQMDRQCKLHHRRRAGNGRNGGRRGLRRRTGLRHPGALLPEPGDVVLPRPLQLPDGRFALERALRTGLHHRHVDRHGRTAPRIAAHGLRPYRPGHRPCHRTARKGQGNHAGRE